MSKFKFKIEAGIAVRNGVRTMLNNSKAKLEYEYDGSHVSIIENKSFLESEFIIQGFGFPDTDDFNNQINNWFDKLKKI